MTRKNRWTQKIFEAKAAGKGNVVRRKKVDVERNVGTDEFVEDVRDRRFHIIETGDQLIIVCNDGDIRILC